MFKGKKEEKYRDININTFIFLINEIIINNIPNDTELETHDNHENISNNEKDKLRWKIFTEKMHKLGFNIGTKIVDPILHSEQYIKIPIK